MSDDRNPKIQMPTPEEVQAYGGSEAEAAPETAPAEEAGGEPASPEQQIARLQEECERLRDRWLRSQAELRNVQRRAASERADAVRYGNVELVRSLLVFIDDLERTIEAGEKAAPDPTPQDYRTLLEGIRLARENLLKALAAHHITRIEASPGTAFDPQVHEAVMQEPTDAFPPMTIVREVQPGYRLHDRVIRASRVVVAAAPGEQGGPGGAPGEAQQQRKEASGTSPEQTPRA